MDLHPSREPPAVRRHAGEGGGQVPGEGAAGPGRVEEALRWARWLWPWHRFAFILVIGGLTGANALWGEGWWAFWPTLLWGAVALVHFLLARSLDVDDAWVEERTEDVRMKAYDMAHIEDIRERLGPPPGPAEARRRLLRDLRRQRARRRR